MTNPSPGEAIQLDKERGAGRAFLLPDDYMLPKLDEIAVGASHADRLALALRSASNERLKAALADQIRRQNTEGALRVSAELTDRGIAPCFRYHPFNRQRVEPSKPHPLTSDQQRQLDSEGACVLRSEDTIKWPAPTIEGDFMEMAADLQWLACRYPKHVPEWKRASAIFDPRKFRKAAEYLYWNGQRTPGQIAKALALTEDQQRECAWIQCLHIERWRGRLLKRLDIARARISAAVRQGDKRAIADQDATIERRCDLWLCAELGDWRPQRTAMLYGMLTGQTLPRNVVAKQLDKLPKVRRSDEVFPS